MRAMSAEFSHLLHGEFRTFNLKWGASEAPSRAICVSLRSRVETAIGLDCTLRLRQTIGAAALLWCMGKCQSTTVPDCGPVRDVEGFAQKCKLQMQRPLSLEPPLIYFRAQRVTVDICIDVRRRRSPLSLIIRARRDSNASLSICLLSARPSLASRSCCLLLALLLGELVSNIIPAGASPSHLRLVSGSMTGTALLRLSSKSLGERASVLFSTRSPLDYWLEAELEDYLHSPSCVLSETYRSAFSQHAVRDA